MSRGFSLSFFFPSIFSPTLHLSFSSSLRFLFHTTDRVDVNVVVNGI